MMVTSARLLISKSKPLVLAKVFNRLHTIYTKCEDNIQVVSQLVIYAYYYNLNPIGYFRVTL